MIKLSDTQLIVLSSAAQRDDGLIVLPERLRGGAAEKVLAALLSKGLIDRLPAAPDRDEDAEGGPVAASRITAAGLAAIGIAAANEPPPDASEATMRSEDIEAPAAKIEVPARAIQSDDMEAPGAASLNPATELPSTPDVDERTGTEREPPESGRHARGSAPRADSKLAVVVNLLSRPEGASLGDLREATGWLPHTTRAALSRLRARGLVVTKDRREDAVTVYRIARQG